MSKETGGFAFPIPGSEHNYPEYGMTLRDYFAAKAMQSIAQSTFCDCDTVAKMSYAVADAMIAEMNKQ